MAYLAKINKSAYINFKLMPFMIFKFLVKCIFFKKSSKIRKESQLLKCFSVG